MADKLGRRGFLGLLAGGAAATTFGTAASAESAAEAISAFYLNVTKAAFDATYGDSLSPEKIHETAVARAPDIADLTEDEQLAIYGNTIAEAVSGTAEEYQANYLAAATEYFESLSPAQLETLSGLFENGSYSESWNATPSLKVFHDDAKNYDGSWRTDTLSEESKTNPLFYAFQALHNDERGMLTQKDATAWVGIARNITHGPDSFEATHEGVTSSLDAVQAAAPAVAPVVPAPEKTF